MPSFMTEPAVILLIDDDPITLTGVAAVLHGAGHECHCARSSEAAWKAARALQLDLIACNVEIDDGDGLRLCQDLKQDPALYDVPLLLLSTAERPELVHHISDANGIYYLQKPFEPRLLQQTVDRALWMPHLIHHHLESAKLAGPHTAATLGQNNVRLA